ncbi:hypothetical protein BXZ70DRAFT_1007172 [Cristinia sonorae]|uniref:Uncharacterized protein n=1 Tax=Cristinia sonorae TaxID=1940300 RepID=A0A8K0US41_9AGAR|nr:hypothetical protein BXZ70DRAFT_1007172 [Cristinia sonorae]
MTSFTDESRHPLCSKWPDGASKIDAPASSSLMNAYDLADIAKSLEVIENPSQSSSRINKHIVVRRDTSRNSTTGSSPVVKQVLFRVHGYVIAASLNATGNWNERIDGCAQAQQFVKLTGGHCDAVFRQQLQSLDAITSYVRHQTSVRDDYRYMLNTHALYLGKRVFRKRIAGSRDHHAVTDSVCTRALEKVGHAWTLTAPIQVMVCGNNHSLAVMPSMVIKRGDFVEVQVIVDVATLSGFGRTTKIVRLAPHRIVQIKADAIPKTVAHVNQTEAHGDIEVSVEDDSAYHVLALGHGGGSNVGGDQDIEMFAAEKEVSVRRSYASAAKKK